LDSWLCNGFPPSINWRDTAGSGWHGDWEGGCIRFLALVLASLRSLTSGHVKGKAATTTAQECLQTLFSSACVRHKKAVLAHLSFSLAM
jgi:hypothetical protein